MSAAAPDGSRYSLGVLFLVAAFFIVAGPIYWHGVQVRSDAIANAYENADLYQGIYPTYHYASARMHAGELPLWNSRQLCGTPFLADPRVGIFQPLNIVFWLLPTERAMAAHAFLTLFLMAAFFVLFARSFGLSYTAATIGAVAYAFCGASAAAMSRPATANALAWVPFVFWTAREYRRVFKYRNAILLGIGGAMLILSGTVALAFAALCVLAPYVLTHAAFPDNRRVSSAGRRISGLALAAGVALALSAAQWLPTAFWLRSLERPIGVLWHLPFSGLSPAWGREALVQFLTSKPGTLPRLLYIGTAPLLLMPAAVIHQTRRREAAYFLAAGAICLIVGLLRIDALPLGYPNRAFLFCAAFCMATLTAIGADRLFVYYRERGLPRPWAPAAIVMVVASLVIYAAGSQTSGYAIAFAVVVLPFVLIRTAWLARLSGLLVAVLLFADLMLANANAYRHPFQDAPECYGRYAAAIRAAEEQALGARALVSTVELDNGLPPNLGMVTPVDAANGDDNLPLTHEQARWWARLEDNSDTARVRKRTAVSYDAGNAKLLNLMAVRAILAAPGSPLFEGDWAHGGPSLRRKNVSGDARVYVNDDALPRAAWVPTPRTVSDTEGALDVLCSPDFDPARECTIDIASAGHVPLPTRQTTNDVQEAEDAPQQRQATCAIVQSVPEYVLVRVDAPAEGILVLADSCAPGWRATVDGSPTRLFQANGVFRGVSLPAGQHDVAFVYRPWAFWTGLAVSLGALASLALGGFLTLVRGA